jgi:hypothetical protein
MFINAGQVCGGASLAATYGNNHPTRRTNSYLDDAISVEGRFKVNNLLGPRPKRVPVPVVRAVIDSDVVHSPIKGRGSDDLLELS